MVKLINAYTLSECLEEMANAVSDYEGLARRNLIFCEDRLTLVAERALMRKTGGTFRSEITTFARFIKAEGKVLSRQGSVMAVGDILTRLNKAGKLRCFLHSGSAVNDAKCIYEQLAQFSSSELTPESLAESVAALTDEALKNKMLDLSLIYAEYDAFLKENGYLDEGKYLTLLPDAIRAERGIERTNIFFLCYSSLTLQAMKTVCAAIEAAENVIGIFLNGEEEIYTGSAYSRFLRAAESCTKVYTVNKGTPLDGEAERLRKGLFAPETLASERMKTDAVRIYAAGDITGEAEYIAVNIRKLLMQNPALKYRDFSVLVPDLAAYSLALKKAFSEFSVPYSMDERISLKRHPISRFLLSAFAVAETRYLPSAVDELLSNLFFGESDEYRNYLLKYGNSRGGALRPLRPSSGYDEEKLNACKARLEWIAGRFKRKAKGKEYAGAVRQLLADEFIKTTLKELEEEAIDASAKSYLAQILPALDGLLAEAELLVGERELALKDFAAVLEDGLDATEIAPTPLKTDAVFVGDITDSRIERTRVLFAVGLTDAVPRSSDDANLVTDKDKEKLSEVKAALEPMVAEVNLRNRENVCLNLCTFTDRLYLTYPLGSDGEGAVSDLFYYIKGLFAGADGNALREAKEFAAEDFKYRCSSPVPAVRQLLVEMGEYEADRRDERREFSSLYAALSERELITDELFSKKTKTLTPRSAELFFTGNTLSPTTLEGYFECPYRNFLSNGLRLKKREETVVMSVDTGNLIHALLERTTGKIVEHPTEESFAGYAKTVCEELLDGPLFAPLKETAAGAYSSENLLKEGVEVARAVYRQLTGSAYQVEALEKVVSTSDFHGKIDRVDATDDFVRIIDYKTSTIDDKPVSYYVGKKMQLQLYMSAAKGEKTPAGVFYFPASVGYTDTEEGKFRMLGFMNGDEEALRQGDRSISDEKKSEYFDAKLTKNISDKVMDGETFSDFLDYAVLVAEKAKEEVRSGYILPTPYESACGYCPYGGACGFCGGKAEPRREKSIKPSEIAAIARRAKEEENDG